MRPTFKLMVFGRRMITKAKKQKGKTRKCEKQKTSKSKSKKPGLESTKKNKELESKDANPHSNNENITIGGRRTPTARKKKTINVEDTN